MDQGFQPTAILGQNCPTTLGTDIIFAIKERYCFYRQKYVVMAPQYTKTCMHYFKDAVIQSHLDGNYALGVFAGEKATRFISFDVDAGGKAAVRLIVDTLVRLGFPKDRIYVSTSGRKGYHIDMFFYPYIYNNTAKNIYDIVIWQTQLDPKKVEFRPTHTQAIKLPLGIHAKTGRRCWFLDTETLEPVEDLWYICRTETIPAESVSGILRTWNRKLWNERYVEMICGDSGSVGNTVLEYDVDDKNSYYAKNRLTSTGTRHDMMLKIARDVRLCGANKFQIAKILNGWYYRQDPVYIDSTPDEVSVDIREISEWAEANVPVIKKRNVSKERKPIVFTKYDINYVLLAPTSAARKAALLIWTYCKIYGASHISYEAIANTIGCVPATAQTAVAALVKNHIINKESGGLHYGAGGLVKKTNTYFIPKEKTLACPADAWLVAEEYEYVGEFNKENFNSYYYKVLGGLCTDEYLARFLTKPELAEVQKARVHEHESDESTVSGGPAA